MATAGEAGPSVHLRSYLPGVVAAADLQEEAPAPRQVAFGGRGVALRQGEQAVNPGEPGRGPPVNRLNIFSVAVTAVILCKLFSGCNGFF